MSQIRKKSTICENNDSKSSLKYFRTSIEEVDDKNNIKIPENSLEKKDIYENNENLSHEPSCISKASEKKIMKLEDSRTSHKDKQTSLESVNRTSENEKLFPVDSNKEETSTKTPNIGILTYFRKIFSRSKKQN